MPDELLVRFEADGALPAWSAWRAEDGAVWLEIAGRRHPISPADALVWDFGGLSAAVGAVPISADLRRPDAPAISLGRAVLLDEWGEEMIPESVRDRLRAALQVVRDASGCALARGGELPDPPRQESS